MPGMVETMKEWHAGTLHSGSKTGPIVKSQKQAIAIGLNNTPQKRLAKALKSSRKPGKK